jgi:16S rRNA (guanine527-N7)-methyltransferase
MMEDRLVPSWLNVSRETLEDLVALEAMIIKWTSAVNLISRASVPEIWHRHILDSAQIASISGFPSGNWVDLGSGGGLPGLVLAVMAKADEPETRFTLIESDARKATFLRQAAQTLSLSVEVITARIGEVPTISAKAMSARALAPLDELLGHAQFHLAKEGKAYFPKGASVDDEITRAERRWRFNCIRHRSHTSAEASILEVSEIELR